MNEAQTVFLGGSNDNYGIVTLDWQTFNYKKHTEKFSRKRWKSACTLLKGRNQEPLVAIAGGIAIDSKGLEIWNPLDGAIKLVSELLPTESENSFGLNHAQLIPINDGTEMVMYGGYQGDYQQEIWKFTVETSSWTKIGNMLVPREEHVVLPVHGVTCSY